MSEGLSNSHPARKGPMPPHGQLFDILRPSEHADLVAWAIRSEQEFKPAKVYIHSGEEGTRIKPEKRTALNLRDLGPMKQVLTDRLMERLPEIVTATGHRGPIPTSLEFELNAYGEGGHFGRHIDVSTGTDRKPLGALKGEDRVLSAVYYFYSEPKSFTGGALRLFRFGVGDEDTEDDSVAYDPLQNSLVAFPSWALHEVERVSCPSGRFSDYRFGLNCWFCTKMGA